MSRTIFQNACIATKVSYSQAIDFERVHTLVIKDDKLGSVRVPVSYFLAKYIFAEQEFYGAGVTKKLAIEHLFSRLTHSEYMPVVPEKNDPTSTYPNATFVLKFCREELSMSLLVVADPNNDDAHPSFETRDIDVPRGRHEALMSLVRFLLRQDAEN